MTVVSRIGSRVMPAIERAATTAGSAARRVATTTGSTFRRVGHNVTGFAERNPLPTAVSAFVIGKTAAKASGLGYQTNDEKYGRYPREEGGGMKRKHRGKTHRRKNRKNRKTRRN